MEPNFKKIDLSHYRNKLIVVDIDGVLALEQQTIPMGQRPVISESQESLKLLREKGYKILLFTSRFRSQKEVTVEWLKRNHIPFDDILFGKPRGILYIDDRGYRFEGWKQFLEDMEL